MSGSTFNVMKTKPVKIAMPRTEKEIRIVTLREIIDYHQKVRKDRKEAFEVWDQNSANLITQYENELKRVEAK